MTRSTFKPGVRGRATYTKFRLVPIDLGKIR
jgi:hypothetical protein